MKTAIILVQIILAVLLVTTILLQARGTGLGSAWGGTSTSYHSKRGIEKLLFLVTVFTAALFLLVSLVNILIG